MSETLILGVGNTLLTDEGAGVHAMAYLQQSPDIPDNVTFVDAGTLSFVLADAIAGADNLIIFDAAQLDREPGSVQVFERAHARGGRGDGRACRPARDRCRPDRHR